MEPMTLELRITHGVPKAVFTRGIPSVEEVDELLRQLAELRRIIEPAVPPSVPPGDASLHDQQSSAHMEVSHLIDGSSGLHLRHAGYGWLMWRVTPKDRKWLVLQLQAAEQKEQLLQAEAARRKAGDLPT